MELLGEANLGLGLAAWLRLLQDLQALRERARRYRRERQQLGLEPLGAPRETSRDFAPGLPRDSSREPRFVPSHQDSNSVQEQVPGRRSCVASVALAKAGWHSIPPCVSSSPFASGGPCNHFSLWSPSLTRVRRFLTLLSSRHFSPLSPFSSDCSDTLCDSDAAGRTPCSARGASVAVPRRQAAAAGELLPGLQHHPG